MILNPDHVTIAVADAGPAIEFFALLGFKKDHVATIDGGLPARYMGMPGMKAQHITLALEGAAYPFEIQLLEFEPIRVRTRQICENGASITSRSASTTLRRPPRTSWPTA
jgi:hypothetical protein